MGQEIINPSPGADIFQDLYNDFNNNANVSIDSMVQAGNLVTFFNRLGGTFGTIALPLSANVILTGLASSVIGFNLSTTAGTYQVANQNFTIGAGAFVIPAAHPTLNRLDVLVVNNLGAYQYLTGTPAVNPSAPTITLNQLIVTYIQIPAASVPNVGGGECCIIDGSVSGQTLRWNQGISDWEINPNIFSTNANLSLLATNSITLSTGVSPTSSEIIITDTVMEMINHNVFGDYTIRISSAGFDIESSAGEATFALGITGGMYINDALPTNTIEKLYNDGGVLYWNGDAICVAPCGGTTVNPGTVDYSTLRWDNVGLDWQENIHTRNNDDVVSWLCADNLNTITGASTYNAFIATSANGGLGSVLQGRNLAIIASGGTNSIIHARFSGGYNYIAGGFQNSITYDPTAIGMSSIEGGRNNQIINSTTAGHAIGYSYIKGSLGCQLIGNIEHCYINGSTSSNVEGGKFCSINNSYDCDIKGSGVNKPFLCSIHNSFTSSIFCSSLGVAEYCTIEGSSNSVITSTDGSLFENFIKGCEASEIKERSKKCAVVSSSSCSIFGGDNCSIYNSQNSNINISGANFNTRCMILSALASNISSSAFASVFNSLVVGGQSNLISADVGIVGNCLILAGATNKIQGTVVNGFISGGNGNTLQSNASNSAIICGIGKSLNRPSTVLLPSIEITEGLVLGLTVVSVNTLLTNIQNVIACTVSGITINFPTTPINGQSHVVSDANGLATAITPITINGNGATIKGVTTILLTVPYQTIQLVYAAFNNSWLVIG